MKMLARLAVLCTLPLLLTSCLLVPGKFVSTLDIHADRSFSFSYKGQVIAADPSDSTSSDEKLAADATPEEKAAAADKVREAAAKAKEREVKNREIAAALAKEAGYRSVLYKGNGLFEIDYQVSGMLTTNFVFPFNSDAEVMIPFVALEVRKDGTVRVRAPGFGKAAGQGASAGPIPMMGDPNEKAEGSFTLSTDAEIVMQNQEDGAKVVGPKKVIVWTIGPIKKDAPTAVLRMRN